MKIKKEKHKPMRTCIQTREKLPKRELLRFVYLKETDEVVFDPSNKARGRGANLKSDLDTFDSAVESNAFSRAFKTKVSKELLNGLRSDVEKYIVRKELSEDGKTISVRVKVDEKVKLG
jgi:uncharacterized protein